MATISRNKIKMDEFITKGLIIGYAYSIVLSVAGVTICELKGKTCDSAWGQGYAIASGMVTTFLAYFVSPTPPPASRSRTSSKSDPSEETDGQTP